MNEPAPASLPPDRPERQQTERQQTAGGVDAQGCARQAQVLSAAGMLGSMLVVAGFLAYMALWPRFTSVPPDAQETLNAFWASLANSWPILVIPLLVSLWSGVVLWDWYASRRRR